MLRGTYLLWFFHDSSGSIAIRVLATQDAYWVVDYCSTAPYVHTYDRRPSYSISSIWSSISFACFSKLIWIGFCTLLFSCHIVTERGRIMQTHYLRLLRFITLFTLGQAMNIRFIAMYAGGGSTNLGFQMYGSAYDVAIAESRRLYPRVFQNFSSTKYFMPGDFTCEDEAAITTVGLGELFGDAGTHAAKVENEFRVILNPGMCDEWFTFRPTMFLIVLIRSLIFTEVFFGNDLFVMLLTHIYLSFNTL